MANASPDLDVINFAAKLDGQTIGLTTDELRITAAVNVDASSLSQGIIIDAAGAGIRVFDIDDGLPSAPIDVGLIGLTLTGGTANHGGAIRSVENLAVVNAGILDNSAIFDGGIFLQRNTGSYYIDVTLRDTTISGNSAQVGGGLWGFVDGFDGALTLINSTISGNTVSADGGGIYLGVSEGGIEGGMGIVRTTNETAASPLPLTNARSQSPASSLNNKRRADTIPHPPLARLHKKTGG